MSRLANRLGALEERPFRLLWLGQAFSQAGDLMIPVAVAFAVLELGGSASELGLVLAAVTLSRAAFMLVGGVWADRLPRHLVMLTSDLVRAATQATLALLLIAGAAQLWHVLVVAVVYGTAAAFFTPAVTGLVPQTVSAARLQEANALMALTRSVLFIAGPIASGILVAAFGAGFVFALDAGTFLVSAGFLAVLRVPPALHSARQAFLADLAAGWREVTSRRWIWSGLAFFALCNLAIAPFWVFGPIVASGELGGAAAWGGIMTGAGIGAALGSAIALRFRPRRPLLAGLPLVAVSALQPALLTRPAPAVVLAGATALAIAGVTIANMFWVTSLQQHVPEEAISRVSSYDGMVSFVIMPLGYVLAGPLAAGLGLDTTLAAGAILLLLASIAIAAVPEVRRLEPAAIVETPSAPAPAKPEDALTPVPPPAVPVGGRSAG